MADYSSYKVALGYTGDWSVPQHAHIDATEAIATTVEGLGTIATQAANSVTITGGSVTGITDLAVADGGTGASDAATARTNLGLGTIATQAANSVNIDGGTIDSTVIGGTTPAAGKFTNVIGNIENRYPAMSAAGNLFTLPGADQDLSFVGPKFEITEIGCVADVAGSLNGKYFRIYGPGGTSASVDTTLAEQIIDVWLDVDNTGTVPASGAGRYIEVDITADATAIDVAAAISTALNADAAFKAGADGAGAVYITPVTPNNFTDATAGDSGFAVTKEQDGSGSLSGTAKLVGGVLAPNGKIYGIPLNSTSVLVIDPATDTASTFGSLSGTDKWYGGVLAPNGKIYGIPYSSTSVLVIDPATDTASTFGSLSGAAKWYGGVLAPNGKIYGIPYNSTSVLVIDPATDTASTFGSLDGAGKWHGGVLAPNSKIYGIPRDSTSVLVIDPATDTASTFGSFDGSLKWLGGVLAPNGKIYGIPRDSTSVLVIDPATDTASTFGSLSGASKWYGGVLAPNGKIYGIPYSSTSVLVIDPATDTASTFGSLSGTAKWLGGVLAPNGKIYGIPLNSTSVLKISTGYTQPADWMLSAYYNKF